MKLILDGHKRSDHALKLRLLLLLLFFCTFGRIYTQVEPTLTERSVNGAQEASSSFIDWLLGFLFDFLFHLVLLKGTYFISTLLDIYLVCIICFNHRVLFILFINYKSL